MKIRVKERMKSIKIYLFALVSIMTLTACPDDEKKGGETPIDPVPVEGQTYQQSATLDAKGTEQTVMLNNLRSKIDDIENSNSWLTVFQNTYSSGSPSITIRATERTEITARSGNVTITAISGDKVILTVTQEGAEEQKTGIDDSHDVPTDQPAYSRQ